MNDNLIVAVIAASSAIIGSFIGGLISFFSSKISLDREDRRRREDLERKTAEERLKTLYKPLLIKMSPSPPYDEGIHFEREDCVSIMDFIEKNELLASPELIRKFDMFQYYFFNEYEKIGEGLDRELYWLVASEYSALKETIGYGSILKQPTLISKMMAKLRTSIKSLHSKWDHYMFMKAVKKRRIKKEAKS